MLGSRTIAASALTVAAAAAIVASPAPAQVSNGLQGNWRARAGIEKARAAGIKISRGSEKAMARAPIGSCPNDPTQAKCPPVTRIVRSSHVVNRDGSVSFAPAIAARATKKDKARATARQFDYMCNMSITANSPYKASGHAQQQSKSYCDWRVTAHELYAYLLKRYNGEWFQMAVSALRAEGGDWIYRHPKYDCTASPRRYWWAYAEGWALVNGGWFWDSRERFDWLYCG